MPADPYHVVMPEAIQPSHLPWSLAKAFGQAAWAIARGMPWYTWPLLAAAGAWLWVRERRGGR